MVAVAGAAVERTMVALRHRVAAACVWGLAACMVWMAACMACVRTPSAKKRCQSAQEKRATSKTGVGMLSKWMGWDKKSTLAQLDTLIIRSGLLR